MFECFLSQEEPTPKTKTIFIMQNGNPQSLLEMRTTKPISTSSILKKIEAQWPTFRPRNLRIFGVDAVELFDEDLLYVKDGNRLYVSRGEEFDSNRNFGEFEILRPIGQGGFGCVSLAKSRITGDLVAIKVMKSSKSTSKCIDMIFREAQFLQSLSHPNIVKIHSCYALKNMNFVVVMEYLEGGELRQQLRKKGKFEQEEARSYFKQILSAVMYCHQNGVVHRDLKPENILLTLDKQVKVADFGLSGIVENNNPQIDWGTLNYMPPEILNKQENTNAFAGDVWACGVILFQMVMGFLPFIAKSSEEATHKIINKQLQFGPDCQISPNCRRLITLMLEKDPKKRINLLSVQASPWITKGAEGHIKIQDAPQKGSQQMIKRPSVMRVKKLPKQATIFIQKKLQKQKSLILHELQGCRMSRKLCRSESKGFQMPRQSVYRKGMRLQSELLRPINRLKGI